MSFFDRGFDASKVEPQGAYKPIPDGEYLFLIKAAAEEKTKKAGGLMLHLECKGLSEGPAKGRELHFRINLENANPQAVEIGQKQLSAVCRAVGVMVPKHPRDFVGKTMTLRIAVEKRADNGALTNEIKGVVLPDEKKQETAGSGTPAAGERPPWER